MNYRTLTGAAWLVVALWAFAALTSDADSPDLDRDEITVACGREPAYTIGLADEWYAYGDCSGDYGPIDAAE